MRRMNPRKIMVVVLILVLICGVNKAYSVLGNRDHHMIRIAYMNGYVQSLNLSPEEREILKNNRALLIETVEASVAQYLSKVFQLNK